MGTRKVKVTEYECDNPSCKEVRYSNPDLPDEPVDGVTLHLGVIDGGGWGTTGWACTYRCAPPATEALLEKGQQ